MIFSSVKTNYHHMDLIKMGLLCNPALIVHISVAIFTITVSNYRNPLLKKV
jgi:hypothetical protein